MGLQLPQVGRSWRLPLPGDVSDGSFSRDTRACERTVCGAQGHCALLTLQCQMSWNKVFFSVCICLRGDGSKEGTWCMAEAWEKPKSIREGTQRGSGPQQHRMNAKQGSGEFYQGEHHYSGKELWETLFFLKDALQTGPHKGSQHGRDPQYMASCDFLQHLS